MITRKPYTYSICPFNRICQLFLLSEVYKTGSKRYKTRQLWGTSPPMSVNKHIRRKAVWQNWSLCCTCLQWSRERGRWNRWTVTGSEKILRDEVFEPSTRHSLGLSDRWKISTAATQIQGEKSTLSEWTSYVRLPVGTRGSSRERRRRKGFGSILIYFSGYLKEWAWITWVWHAKV